jgi:hypothetical protein
MAQNWGDFPGTEKVKDSRQDLLDRFDTLRSNWSGATAPATPVLWQWWMDTTAGKLKLCTQVTPSVVWQEVPFGVALAALVQTARLVATATGLSGGGSLAADRTIALDFNALTADASPDRAADYVATYDASASAHKKVLLNALAPAATDALAGLLELADQAEMEAGTDTGRAVTPGRVKFSANTVKEFVAFSDNTTATVLTSLSVSSLTDNGVGDVTINHTQAFSSASYAPSTACRGAGVSYYYGSILHSVAPTASALRVYNYVDGTLGGGAALQGNWQIAGDF